MGVVLCWFLGFQKDNVPFFAVFLRIMFFLADFFLKDNVPFCRWINSRSNLREPRQGFSLIKVTVSSSHELSQSRYTRDRRYRMSFIYRNYTAITLYFAIIFE